MDASNQGNERQTGQGGPEQTASRLERLRTYAKENPTTVLAAGAGAGLLFGVQFAMGAALRQYPDISLYDVRVLDESASE